MPKFLDQEGVKYLWSQVALEDYPNNETLATVLNAIDSTKVDKIDGKGLSTNDYTTAEKEKLANISAGAEVNQNAFGKVKIDTTTITANSKTDTLTFVAGDNITLTPDATNDGITITAQDTTYSAATTSANGLMSSTDKTRVDDLYKRIAGYAVTAGTTAAYTATITGVTLTHGTMIALRFNAANAKNATLDINSLGAKPIYYKGAAITASIAPANAVMLLVYDTTQVSTGAWHCIYSYDANTTYTNAALGQGYATCDTAAATVAKTAALSSYALTTGGIIAVKFTYNVPASATLNINSKGAKPIYYHNQAITAGVINAGNTATFIYNGSQYHLIAIDSSSSSGDFLEIDITDVEQGTATGINADILGGVVASEYVLHDELDTEVNDVITELNTLKTDISNNYVLKNEIDKLSNSAQIDLAGAGSTGETVLTNADLLAGMTYRQIMDSVYPIGRVIMTFESEDPNVLYSWQTWERTANGRFLLGASDSYTVGSEGGEAEHTLTIDEMPSHTHTTRLNTGVTMGNISGVHTFVHQSSANDPTDATGGSQPHNNMPPYVAVNMWKRTA